MNKIIAICISFIFILFSVEINGFKDRSASSDSRKTRQITHANDASSSGSSSGSGSSEIPSFPWVNLSMKIPPRGEGSSDKIDEINLVLQFDDDTPPSKMTIVDPNITWTGEEGHHHISILEPVITGIHVKDNSSRGVIDVITTSTSNKRGEENCQCNNIDEIVTQLKEKNLLCDGLNKGDKGHAGTPGLSIQGPKGEPGDPASIPYHLTSFDPAKLKGDRGPPGPPGLCTPRDCGDAPLNEGSGSGRRRTGIPPSTNVLQSTTTTSNKGPSPDLYKIVPGALVFQTRRAMLQMQQFSFIGTVAFVEADEMFYGRVRNGWRSFTMGSRVHRIVMSTPNYQQQEELQQRPHEATRNAGVVNCTSGASVRGQGQGPVLCINNRTPNPVWLKTKTRRANNPAIHEEHGGDLFQLITHKADDQTMARRVIGLNSPLSGNMGGHNQVNYQCQRQAMKNNLHGIFRALLNLSALTMDPSLVLVNMKNESLLSLNDGNDEEDWKLFSFNGKELTANALRAPSLWGGQLEIWGSSKNGIINGENDCQSWTSNGSNDEGTFSQLKDLNVFVKADERDLSRLSPCDMKRIVLCYEFLHMSQVNIRHRNNNSQKVRLSFNKYLEIIKAYDDMMMMNRREKGH